MKAKYTNALCQRLIKVTLDLNTLVTDVWGIELLDKQRAYLWKVFEAKIQAPWAQKFADDAADEGISGVVFKKFHKFFTELALAEAYAEMILHAIQLIQSEQFSSRVNFINKFSSLNDSKIQSILRHKTHQRVRHWTSQDCYIRQYGSI